MKYNILIGGSAGQGMSTISFLLQKILKRKGFYIFSNKDYMSRVRGGHNFIQIRFGDEPITSYNPNLDVIIALDQNTINFHKDRLNDNGIIICDDEINTEESKKNIINIPMKDIAKEVGNRKVFGSAALGAIIKSFNLSMDKVESVFNDRFSEKVAHDNLEAFKKGYGTINSSFNINEDSTDDSILINGNQAIGLGAIAGGVNFYSAYPMTPATSIMTFLAKNQQEAGIMVEQAEDEIAAINMAIGASYAGIRAMTGSSGGGFSLMVETLGLVAITEIPLVVVNVQRPGPATGLPTRTAQSDLNFMLSSSQDEFPRMVIAVRNPEDAFYQTVRALNIADKYQMLVILLNDQYLADYNQTIKAFDMDKVSIDRHLSNDNILEDNKYKRYKLTESGISPRIVPGRFKKQTVLADSHEHNEYGFVEESSENRINMMKKRMNKMELLKEELKEPEYYGDDNPDILLLGWGSMDGALKEVTKMFKNKGINIGALVFGDIYPLPTEELIKYSNMAEKIINVEQNYTGQLARLIKSETNIKCTNSILKYDGRQLNSYEIYNKLKSEVL
ncbi:2-oxoacid:acceptor oxidoreductase subunit alpha [Dethiothermospora halolimnae]|uniref:2-oxoacid:acceptor oxidoreductase subunit alpha n=1 Tax=Dethiothermospora halolimnae TaxID=3114390 RepID=UPI003CCC2642